MSEFTQFLHASGYSAAPEIIEAGKWYRFPRPGKDKGKDAFAMIFDDGDGGIYGDFTEGVHHHWRSDRMQRMPDAEREALAAVHRLKVAQAEQARNEEYARKAIEAATLWDSLPAAEEHPYLSAKGIKANGLRLHGDRLCIPAYTLNESGTSISTLQFISADGEKRFFTGGRMSGAFHTIDGDHSTIYLCEGYATGATIHEATGCTVIVAFNAGNLMSVAKAVRSKAKDTPIIICADDDFKTEGNPGVTAANNAAEAVGASVIVPVFQNRTEKYTDFNDLYLSEGLETVKAQLVQTSYILDLDDYTYTAQGFDGEPEQRQWLIEGVFPLGQTTVLASIGGLGKSYLTLDLAHKVALAKKEDFFGIHSKTAFGRIASFGTAVYISAEDDKIEIHSRLASLDPAKMIYTTGRGNNLIVVPCPSTGQNCRLFVSDHDEVRPTRVWLDIVDKLKQKKDLRLIAIDPIQALIAADMNNPSHVQAIVSELNRLAADTGAAVLFLHHGKKPANQHPIETPADARESIRGSGAIVDSVRSAIVLWEPEQSEGQDICEAMNVNYTPGVVAQMAVVKSNGASDKSIKTLIRSEHGLLEDRTSDYRQAKGEAAGDLEMAIASAIKNAYLSHNGFTFNGKDGLYARRDELPPEFIQMDRKALEGFVNRLMVSGIVRKDLDNVLYLE